MADGRFVVVGAGVMGLWSALLLRESGHDVLLVDAWEPGHARATSADENRVIRCGYGGSRLYAAWAQRSLAIWDRRQRDWEIPLLYRCGVLWMVAGQEAYARACQSDLEALGTHHERLDRRAFAKRYPQVRPAGIRWGLLEPDSGALMARRACHALYAAFTRAGGRFLMARVLAPAPGPGSSGRIRNVRLAGGGVIGGEDFLFAAGPWLPGLFPNLLSRRIRVTHKEVFYFGTPPGDDSFTGARLPIWMELGTDCYGVPSLEGKGFKMHPDLQGRVVDPTSLERRTSPRFLKMARECLRRRFPLMRDAPVVETRVCQYETTRDDHMIFDRHPDAPNIWMAGGGSGHCFKHGPVIGEMIAAAMETGDLSGVPASLRLAHRPEGRNF